MYGLYTITYEEWCNNHVDIETEVEETFDKLFPSFVIGDEQISMYSLFKSRNLYKDIGCETDEMFEHELKRKLTEVAVEYNKKITMYLSNFDKLFERVLTLEYSSDNKYYLNPVLDGGGKLQDQTKNDGTHQQAYGYFKSNPDIMKAILDIKDIYSQALREFDILFMVVLWKSHFMQTVS